MRGDDMSAKYGVPVAIVDGNLKTLVKKSIEDLVTGDIDVQQVVENKVKDLMLNDSDVQDVMASFDDDTTYDNATTSTAGLMSADDKIKLDGISSGANAVYSYEESGGINVHVVTITY